MIVPKLTRQPCVLEGAIAGHHACRRWDVLCAFDAGEGEVAFWLRHSNRLTHEEKKAIMRGQVGSIVRPLEPTWDDGDWLEVAAGLDIVVTRVRWSRNYYRTSFNKRDFRPNLMRRSIQVLDPPAFDMYGEPLKPTEAAIKAARIDGAYCQTSALSVPDSAEEVGIDTQEKFAEQGSLNYRIVHAERVAKQDIRSVSQKLRRVQGEAARKGVDISQDVKAIKRQVEGLESKLSEAA